MLDAGSSSGAELFQNPGLHGRYISKKIQIVPIVMKPGSLDSSGDVEYYGFYSFALPFLVFEIFNF